MLTLHVNKFWDQRAFVKLDSKALEDSWKILKSILVVVVIFQANINSILKP